MIGHKALLAHCAVLSRHAHAPVLFKFIQQQQVASRASTQQERHVGPLTSQLCALIEQRSHTHAASYEQKTGRSLCNRRNHLGERCKSASQRQHAIEPVTSLQLSQPTRTGTHHGHKQPQLVLLTIDKINGNRPPQKGRRLAINAHLNKLASRHLWQKRTIVGGQPNQHITIVQPFQI